MNWDQGRMMTSDEDMWAFVPKKFWEYAEVFINLTFDSLPLHSVIMQSTSMHHSFLKGGRYTHCPYMSKKCWMNSLRRT
jgi:hypothetical protein